MRSTRFALLGALFLVGVAASALTAGATAPIGRGDDRFWLGMARTQVDSAVTARGDSVVSDGVSFLVCRSDDPAVEYVQYSFVLSGSTLQTLWKVTVGYRLTASPADFEAARASLVRLLGEPTTDSWSVSQPTPDREPRPADGSAFVDWADAATLVRLGARWSDHPDPVVNRMQVTWIDRRLQRLVEAGARKIVKRRDRGSN